MTCEKHCRQFVLDWAVQHFHIIGAPVKESYENSRQMFRVGPPRRRAMPLIRANSGGACRRFLGYSLGNRCRDGPRGYSGLALIVACLGRSLLEAAF